jgi:hypothetical protein
MVLILFHFSRITAKNNLRISGKEIDLYLLYQIVTSHGGWEKVRKAEDDSVHILLFGM